MKKISKNNSKIINIYGNDNKGKIIIIFLLLKYLNKNNKKILILDFNKKIPKEYFYFKIKNKLIKNKLIKNNNEEKNIKKDNIEIKNIKLNNNIDLININFLLNKKNKNKYFYIYFFNKLISKNKNKFNYIIINFNHNHNLQLKTLILKNTDINNFIFLKKSLGIKELKWIFYYQKNYIKKQKNNLRIIKNRHNLFSIDSKILNNILYKNTKIINFKYKKIYNNLRKNFYKIKINKKTEKLIQQIIN